MCHSWWRRLSRWRTRSSELGLTRQAERCSRAPGRRLVIRRRSILPPTGTQRVTPRCKRTTSAPFRLLCRAQAVSVTTPAGGCPCSVSGTIPLTVLGLGLGGLFRPRVCGLDAAVPGRQPHAVPATARQLGGPESAGGGDLSGPVTHRVVSGASRQRLRGDVLSGTRMLGAYGSHPRRAIRRAASTPSGCPRRGGRVAVAMVRGA
jgi:hypothetical protein